ncbi:MAG TPA: hypothetical protein DHN29_05325 [Cytophagales bacterium]|nr:hypothetical protein [Cytophagales bacterium]
MAMSDTKSQPIPLVETLVFDIVNYLLDNNGYGYSTDIAQEMLRLKPRRYTSREVIGILRNRPMFRHAQSKERRGGIRWRLDLLSLKKYLHQKGYEERADARNLHDKIRNLKWRQMLNTYEALNLLVEEMSSDSSPDSDDGVVSEVTLNYCYEKLAQIWS